MLQQSERATAIPTMAGSPAAADPIFFVAAPVKAADALNPVFEGATGAIGDPAAAVSETKLVPEPELEPAFALELAPDIPVAAGADADCNIASVRRSSQTSSFRGKKRSLMKGSH